MYKRRALSICVLRAGSAPVSSSAALVVVKAAATRPNRAQIEHRPCGCKCGAEHSWKCRSFWAGKKLSAGSEMLFSFGFYLCKGEGERGSRKIHALGLGGSAHLGKTYRNNSASYLSAPGSFAWISYLWQWVFSRKVGCERGKTDKIVCVLWITCYTFVPSNLRLHNLIKQRKSMWSSLKTIFCRLKICLPIAAVNKSSKRFVNADKKLTNSHSRRCRQWAGGQ